MSLKPAPFKVNFSTFNQTVDIPTSKSHANRLLILGAIDKRSVMIKNIPHSSDVLTMIDVLKRIGLNIIEEGKNIRIINSFPECEKNSIDDLICLESGDGGTTNRFLMAFLARGEKTYFLNAKGGMRDRPMEEIENVLNSCDVEIKRGSGEDPYWYKIKGPYKYKLNKIDVESFRSTQFASAFLLALCDHEVNINPVNMENSGKYFDLTISLVNKFKKGLIDYNTPIDFSSLSYPLALALIHGEVVIENYQFRDDLQPDSIFLDIIEKMGGKYATNNKLRLQKEGNLNAIDIDCSGFPDLVPTLAFVCSYAKGESVLRNLAVLRHKESDRVYFVCELLDLFEIDYIFDKKNDDLKILGSKKRCGFKTYDAPSDHRIIMIAYLFMRVNGGGEITNFHHVQKSFPNFFEKMK